MPINGDYWYTTWPPSTTSTTTDSGGNIYVGTTSGTAISGGNISIGTVSQGWYINPTPIYFEISCTTAPIYTISATDIVAAQPMTMPCSELFFVNTSPGTDFMTEYKKTCKRIERSKVPKGCQLSFDF